MQGRKNHSNALVRGFVVVAITNVVLSLALVTASSAKDPDKASVKPASEKGTATAVKSSAKTEKGSAKTETRTAKTETSSAKTEKGSAKTEKGTDKAAKPSVGKISVWELQQQCKGIKDVNCLISPDAVRIRADKMNITFLFKAPKWDAYMFNTDTKNFCSFPYEEWRNKGFFSQVMKTKKIDKDKKAQMKVKKTGKSQQIAGRKTTEIAIDTAEGERYATIWTTTGTMVPKQFAEVISSLVMVPFKENGAPLRVEVRMRNSPKIEPVLDTKIAIEKQVDASLFDQPVGYKKVRDEMALLFAEKEGDEGDDSSMFSFDADPKLKKKVGPPR